MIANRYDLSSTSTNVRALFDIFQDGQYKEMTFFATVRESDMPSTQDLPWLGVLVTYNLPHMPPIYTLFDGYVLSAARQPRYDEIRRLLDLVVDGNTKFCTVPVPLTCKLPAEAAVALILDLENVEPLSSESRPKYFKMLSMFSERSFKEMAENQVKDYQMMHENSLKKGW
jgi:hypothetical protein